MPHHHDLLRIGLRSRAATVTELASLAMCDPDDVRPGLERLQAEGWLTVRGDRIVYGGPAQATARLVRQRTGELADQVRDRLSSLAELVGGVPEPPGWFWVADGETVALPLIWGEAWPTSVMAVRSPAVAGMAQWVFDRLCESAVAVPASAHTWDPLPRLMGGGATLERAARTLGISDRTGRRRVAEAMAHYGVGNMLALGVAWGAQQATSAPGGRR